MICSTCSKSINLLTKKKCQLCSNYYCFNCLYTIKPLLFQICSTNNRCRICFLSSGNFNKNDLNQFSTKELLLYLSRCLVKVERGYERRDVVDLVMITSHQSTQIVPNVDHEIHLQNLMNRMNELHDSNELINSTHHTSECNLISVSPPTQNQNLIQPIMAFNNISYDLEEDNIIITSNTLDEPTENLSNLRENLETTDPNLLTIPNTDKNEFIEEIVPVSNTEKKHKRRLLDEIKDLNELQLLTIRQLKDLLAYNYVDYKGCCERVELLQKVEMLWKENFKNNSIIDTSEEICRICMDHVIDCVLLECGHMVACSACGKRLAECPICRCYVSRVVHIFRA